jgi:hypothetical protein
MNGCVIRANDIIESAVHGASVWATDAFKVWITTCLRNLYQFVFRNKQVSETFKMPYIKGVSDI